MGLDGAHFWTLASGQCGLFVFLLLGARKVWVWGHHYDDARSTLDDIRADRDNWKNLSQRLLDQNDDQNQINRALLTVTAKISRKIDLSGEDEG